MARIVKEYSVRRNEILDTARQLVYTKGYEQMTIQDILDTLDISKGAFYHYFDSKESLLEALIDRIIDEAIQLMHPIVEDPNLSAIEKFQRYFDTLSRWKTAQKAFMLKLLQIWYTDDNAIVRQKVLYTGTQRILPELAAIIRQGIQEGVLSTPYPDQIGEVVLYIMMAFSESMAQIILSSVPGRDDLPRLETMIGMYNDALERVMGAPANILNLIDIDLIKEWLVPGLIDEINPTPSSLSN
jgi:AcrR family transcriptional regulator